MTTVCTTAQHRARCTQQNAAQLVTRRQATNVRRSWCYGILDSYRKAQGIQRSSDGEAQAQQSSTSFKRIQTVAPLLTFESQDDDTCPAECVIEVSTPAEFKQRCQEARDAVVVLDLYKTSCGACKYLMPGFLNICKNIYSTDHPGVIFLKHNVFDDEMEEKTDLARRLRVQGVPKFMIFKNMELVEEFSTRDKSQLVAAIDKHSGCGEDGEPLM